MVAAGLVLAALASALHVYIFCARVRPLDRTAYPSDVRDQCRRGKCNQRACLQSGFYNLFLAIMTVVASSL